ncbi:MAG: family 78 glycoside hydrolase catalytic domain [Roseburia sp.]|nr:family 78 glycoside hydrolase catalytic domain [Roseburia sp.]
MSRYVKADMYDAKWISTGGKCNTPLIRGMLKLPQIRKANITVAGLGIYELYINGKKVSEDLFLPLNSDYTERTNIIYGSQPFHEEFRHRLYCPVYDITSYLAEGINTVCFMMGPGWYELPQDGYGTIKLCYSIEYTDTCGEKYFIGSDNSLKWKQGYVKNAHLLTGESHDYTDYDDSWMVGDFDDSSWEKVTVEEAPITNLYIQDCPADKIIRHVSPQLIREQDGVRMYDAGEILTGYPVFVSTVAAGKKLSVRYGEMLNEDGNLNEEHTYGQHTDFITDGTARKMHCKFTWMCFRYFEVIGDARVEDCVVIHSDVDVTSSFSCDSEILNWIRAAYIRTQLDNMHCGIPSDCPHAERRGYTGDGQLTCAAAMLQLDAQKFYRKWIYDIADCQDSRTGHVQYTAPFLPSGGGPGGWGCAIVMVPYAYYKQYGDVTILKELYPQMLHWFEYMEAHSENELVTSDLEGVWCLGDWCAPAMTFNQLEAMMIPAPLVNTYFYIKAMEHVLEINDQLDIHDNDSVLLERIGRKKESIVNHYFEMDSGNFAGNLQGSNVFALDLGLGDERTFQNMVQHYQQLQKYDTGIFGTDILTRYLFEHGEEDLAIALLTTRADGSFYQQMKNGATTISEYWTGFRSQCHPMFGAVSKYLFEYILGIRQTENSTRFEHLVIEPKCMHLIDSAQGYITTPIGKVSVEYNKEYIDVFVPEDAVATLKLSEMEYVLQPGEYTHIPLLKTKKSQA